MANVVKSSGNVFADLGFADAETHALKAEMVRRVAGLIKQQRLTQKAAAGRMGVSQPDVSKILKGQFRAYSVERLIRFLNALGQDVEITVKKPMRKKARGKVSVHAA